MIEASLVCSPTDAARRSLRVVAADERPGIWIALVDEAVALAAAADVEARVAAGEHLPLAGLTFAVKDNIDVVGFPTTAGCPAYAYEPTRTAPAVVALQRAGAVVIGKTNLDQFATGLVGTRSPFGSCPNSHWPELVSGGSSSGSAVAVAAGHVDFALGTDTAGSGRVPAAANAIVGVKPSRGRISTQGVVPACASLDCVSVFARDVALAARVADIASCDTSGPAGDSSGSAATGPIDRLDDGGGRLRLGVPSAAQLAFDGDPLGALRFARAVSSLASSSDAVVVDVGIGPFLAAGRLLYEGSFVAERHAAVGAFVETHPADVDPVVSSIISAAASITAADVERDQRRLAELRAETARVWAAVAVLVVPSVPRVPTLAEVMADPFGPNAMLGTYTNFVNLLDLAAVTIPVPPPDWSGADGPPPSLTLIGPAGSDHLLAAVALQALGETSSEAR